MWCCQSPYRRKSPVYDWEKWNFVETPDNQFHSGGCSSSHRQHSKLWFQQNPVHNSIQLYCRSRLDWRFRPNWLLEEKSVGSLSCSAEQTSSSPEVICSVPKEKMIETTTVGNTLLIVAVDCCQTAAYASKDVLTVEDFGWIERRLSVHFEVMMLA